MHSGLSIYKTSIFIEAIRKVSFLLVKLFLHTKTQERATRTKITTDLIIFLKSFGLLLFLAFTRVLPPTIRNSIKQKDRFFSKSVWFHDPVEISTIHSEGKEAGKQRAWQSWNKLARCLVKKKIPWYFLNAVLDL